MPGMPGMPGMPKGGGGDKKEALKSLLGALLSGGASNPMAMMTKRQTQKRISKNRKGDYTMPRRKQDYYTYAMPMSHSRMSRKRMEKGILDDLLNQGKDAYRQGKNFIESFFAKPSPASIGPRMQNQRAKLRGESGTAAAARMQDRSSKNPRREYGTAAAARMQDQDSKARIKERNPAAIGPRMQSERAQSYGNQYSRSVRDSDNPYRPSEDSLDSRNINAARDSRYGLSREAYDIRREGGDLLSPARMRIEAEEKNRKRTETRESARDAAQSRREGSSGNSYRSPREIGRDAAQSRREEGASSYRNRVDTEREARRNRNESAREAYDIRREGGDPSSPARMREQARESARESARDAAQSRREGSSGNSYRSPREIARDAAQARREGGSGNSLLRKPSSSGSGVNKSIYSMKSSGTRHMVGGYSPSKRGSMAKRARPANSTNTLRNKYGC